MYEWGNFVLLYLCIILYNCLNTDWEEQRKDIWLRQAPAVTAADPVRNHLGQTVSKDIP